MFFGDRVAALREMGRVAAPDGRVAVQVPGRLAAQPGLPRADRGRRPARRRRRCSTCSAPTSPSASPTCSATCSRRPDCASTGSRPGRARPGWTRSTPSSTPSCCRWPVRGPGGPRPDRRGLPDDAGRLRGPGRRGRRPDRGPPGRRPPGRVSAMPGRSVGDVELEYEVQGSGDAVLFVHGGLCADWFRDLLGRPELAGHRLIRYHRVGYAGSGGVDGPLGIRGQAAHGRALLRHLGVARAHVVGHSSGAAVALQLALDHPGRGALARPAGDRAARRAQRAVRRRGDRPVPGRRPGRRRRRLAARRRRPGYRATLDRVLPGRLRPGRRRRRHVLRPGAARRPRVVVRPRGRRRASGSRCSPCSAAAAARSPRRSRSATGCSRRWLPAAGRSCSRARPTCSTSTTPAAWPLGWPASSPTSPPGCECSPYRGRG